MVSTEVTIDNAGEVTTSPLGHITRTQLVKLTGKSHRFWLRLEKRGKGPPVVHLGKTPVYRLSSVNAWLASLEKPAFPRRRKR
jgi:hypothetical protein